MPIFATGARDLNGIHGESEHTAQAYPGSFFEERRAAARTTCTACTRRRSTEYVTPADGRRSSDDTKEGSTQMSYLTKQSWSVAPSRYVEETRSRSGEGAPPTLGAAPEAGTGCAGMKARAVREEGGSTRERDLAHSHTHANTCSTHRQPQPARMSPLLRIHSACYVP